MKNYLEYAEELKKLMSRAAEIPLGAPCEAGKAFGETFKADSTVFAQTCAPRYLKSQKKVLRECGFKVTDVAVTLGSNKARRPGRRAELAECCKRLSWDLKICADGEGFDNINPKSRGTLAWRKAAEEIAKIISSENPAAIFFPHKNDWNKTHCGVSLLLSDALAILGDSYGGMVFETEYWGAMKSPNLMVEIPEDILGFQMEATSCHTKEVERNPYHIRIPSWMSDNVRRGGEIVGGQGNAAPNFAFAVLLRAKIKTPRGY